MTTDHPEGEDTRPYRPPAPPPGGPPAGLPSDTQLYAHFGGRQEWHPGLLVAERYELIDEIGQGGQSLVWLARDRHLDNLKVAVRRLTDEVAGLVQREIRAHGRLEHQNVIQIRDARLTPRASYLVLQYVPAGEFLQSAPHTLKSAGQALRLFVDLCRAVQFIHDRGILHLDIKPSNVLLATPGGPPVVKLADFGLAAFVGESGDDAGGIGTPEYAAPEQGLGKGKVGERTDVFGLGALMYELLCGRPFRTFEPGTANPWEVVRRELEQPPPRRRPSAAVARSDSPFYDWSRSPVRRAELDAIVLKATATHPEERYLSAAAMADDVERYLSGADVLAVRSMRRGRPWFYRARRYTLRNFKPVCVAAACLALAVTAGLFFWLGEVDRQRLQKYVRHQEKLNDGDATRLHRGIMLGQSEFGPLQRDYLEWQVRVATDNPQKGYDPVTYHRHLATVYHQVGATYAERHEVVDAERHLKAALALWERLTADAPDEPTGQAALAETLLALSTLGREADGGAGKSARQTDGRLEEAEGFGRRALEVCRSGRARTGDVTADSKLHAKALTDLGLAVRDRAKLLEKAKQDPAGRWEEAVTLLTEAQRVFPVRLEPGETGVRYLRLFNNLGNTHLSRYEARPQPADLDSAADQFGQGVAAGERLAHWYPNDLDLVKALAQNLQGLAKTQLAAANLVAGGQAGHPDGVCDRPPDELRAQALASLQRVRGYRESLIKARPAQIGLRADLASCLLTIAACHESDGRPEEALTMVTDGLKVLEPEMAAVRYVQAHDVYDRLVATRDRLREKRRSPPK